MTHGPEFLVKKKVKALLTAHGAVFFMPQMGGFGKAGVSDIIACHNGRFIAVECKAGKGTTTPLQEQFLANVHTAGGYALVVNETDGWDDLIEILKHG